jgi:hypothetical protein
MEVIQEFKMTILEHSSKNQNSSILHKYKYPTPNGAGVEGVGHLGRHLLIKKQLSKASVLCLAQKQQEALAD